MRLIIELLGLYLVIFVNICESGQLRDGRNQSQIGIHNPNSLGCNTAQIEYRLTKLEVQTAERGEALKSELRENNRRLQSLEWQNAEVEAALDGLKAELSRFTAAEQNSHANRPDDEADTLADVELEKKLDGLTKAVHLAIAAIKLNNAEVKSLKQDLGVIKNNTRKIFAGNEHLLNKEFFNDALTEVKHRLNVRHVSDKCYSTVDDKPKDCVDLQKLGKKSGVYKIFPGDYPQGIMVLCEMDTNGGGWAVIQNRFDGSQNFYQAWHNYKQGFGNLGGEFWLGLDNVYHLTGHEINELLVELVDHTSTTKHARYGAFSIGSEIEGYAIKLLSDYSGDAGDSLMYHAGSRFSSKDLDQDSWDEGNCAKSHGGGWWYKACDTSNLNGKYLNGELPEHLIYQGMYWSGFRGAQYSLKQARMLIRPRDKAVGEQN